MSKTKKLDHSRVLTLHKDLAITEISAPSKSDSKLPIVGIGLDLGTSNCKIGAINKAGALTGIWTTPTNGSFLEGGYVNLKDYTSRALQGLRDIFSQKLDFSSLQFISAMG